MRGGGNFGGIAKTIYCRNEKSLPFFGGSTSDLLGGSQVSGGVAVVQYVFIISIRSRIEMSLEIFRCRAS